MSLTQIFSYILVFYFGIIIGFFFRRWLDNRTADSGVIVVTHDEGKLLYSIELNDNPEELQYMEQVKFKVDRK